MLVHLVRTYFFYSLLFHDEKSVFYLLITDTLILRVLEWYYHQHFKVRTMIPNHINNSKSYQHKRKLKILIMIFIIIVYSAIYYDCFSFSISVKISTSLSINCSRALSIWTNLCAIKPSVD